MEKILTSCQGNPIVLCNDDDMEIQSMVSECIPIPSTVDCLQTILNIIPFQLLALQMATFRGEYMRQTMHTKLNVRAQR